jgi:Zn-dependent peptidase ImmA (M78 family)
VTPQRFQDLGQLEDALRARGLDPASHQEFLARVRLHLVRYSNLEKKLLGRVQVPVPSYLLELDLPSDPVEAAEETARKERDRLGLGDEEVGDVVMLLDREGLKVYRPPVPGPSPLEGIFLFDSEVGPAFVLSSGLDPSSSQFVLARLYGHYLMDNDPYEIQLAVRGETPDTALRARAFAAAFLVSREGLERYLKAVDHVPGQPLSMEEVDQLGVFFDVGPHPLILRLLLLGYLRSEEVGSLLSSLPSRSVSPQGGGGSGPVSERFVRLALQAHAGAVLSEEELARYLETSIETARGLAARFDPSSGSQLPPHDPS